MFHLLLVNHLRFTVYFFTTRNNASMHDRDIYSACHGSKYNLTKKCRNGRNITSIPCLASLSQQVYVQLQIW